MKKIISILTIFVFALFVSSLGFRGVSGNSFTDLKLYEYYNEFEFDYSNVNQKVFDVDSIFIGKVIKLEETIKVNKHGFDEVFSLFTIEVINVLKGDIIDSEINLVFLEE